MLLAQGRARGRALCGHIFPGRRWAFGIKIRGAQLRSARDHGIGVISSFEFGGQMGTGVRAHVGTVPPPPFCHEGRVEYARTTCSLFLEIYTVIRHWPIYCASQGPSEEAQKLESETLQPTPALSAATDPSRQLGPLVKCAQFTLYKKTKATQAHSCVKMCEIHTREHEKSDASLLLLRKNVRWVVG